MIRVCTLSYSNPEHDLFLHLLNSHFDFLKINIHSFLHVGPTKSLLFAVQVFFVKIARWFLKLSWVWANRCLSNSACFMIMALYSLPFPSDSCYQPSLHAHVLSCNIHVGPNINMFAGLGFITSQEGRLLPTSPSTKGQHFLPSSHS